MSPHSENQNSNGRPIDRDASEVPPADKPYTFIRPEGGDGWTDCRWSLPEPHGTADCRNLVQYHHT